MKRMVERREQRSEDPYTALRYQLEHARSKGRMDAVVLSMADGLLVAGVGDPDVCEELGAIAPLMTRSLFGARMPSTLEGADVAVRPIAIHGEQLYLASLGGSVARDAVLQHSIQGLTRILTTN